MRKIISAICMLAILCTVLVPMSSVSVSAAAEEGWSQWKLAGNAKVTDGILYMTSGDGTTATYSGTFPDRFTLSFSMKVNSASSSMGLQGGNGSTRGGFYFTSGGGRAMDDAEVTGVWPSFKIANIGSWHDYRMEVDHIGKNEKIYVDDVLVADLPLKGHTIKNYYFWCYGTGGSYELSDISIGVEEPEVPEMQRTMEYTESFFDDFTEGPEGWRVEPEPYVTHDAENGVLRLTVVGDVSYRSFERPLTSTANYDMEFRLRFPEIPSNEVIVPGGVWISLSTKAGHTWTFIERDRVAFWDMSTETNNGAPLAENAKGTIYNKLEYDKWQTWKASVRDGHMTWYIDGKKLVNFPIMTENALNWNAVAIWTTHHSSSEMADVECDWVRYTPYFDDELSLEYPHSMSDFAESSDILIQATTPSGADKIDYYVNDVLVGSGYKANEYKYTLKNAKAGKYRVKAKLENIETAETAFTVKKFVDAKVLLDRNSVNMGECVKATAQISAIGEVASVEFYVDGKFHSTDLSAPYEAQITADEVGTSAVRVKVFTKAGSYAESEDVSFRKNYVEGTSFKTSSEYEINYSYDGNSGSIDLKDGYFNLNLKHQGDKLTYKTSEGDEVYEGLKAGDYKVVVSAGYGEFYWNNQFVMSFRMPYAPSAQAKEVSGLKNVKIGGSGVKTTYVNLDINGQSKVMDDSVWKNQYYSIEFDKNDSSPETIIFNDGIFRNALYFREDGLYARRILSPAHEPTELKLTDSVEPGYYRITVAYGVAIVNLNNKPISEYRCVQAAGLPRLERTMTNPSASTFVAVKNSDEKFYHYDSFENITEYPSEDYWAPNNVHYTTGQTDKITYERREDSTGNHYMNIEGTGTYILNAIDLNPTFRWRGMVEEKAGKVYMQFRRSYADGNSKIGYDFEKQEWFIEVVEDTATVHTVATKYAPDAFDSGKWYDFELLADDFDIALLCNGKTVISGKVPHLEKILMYGRVGFGVIGGAYCFDDVVFEGKDRATAGFSFTTGGAFGQTSVTNTAASFYKDADGNIVATSLVNSLVSEDKGKTWGDLVLSSASDTKGRIFEEQMVIQPDGTYVKINPTYARAAGVYHTSQVSTDGGKTWTEKSNIAPSEVYGHMGAVSRSKVSMDGRIFYCTTMGSEYYGSQFIFYSDDGINWTKSETDINTDNTGVVMNEMMVVDTPRENEVWAYARSDTGFIVYWISRDNGKTFELAPHYSGLPQSACCYRIERDWNNPNTYYAIFSYEATDTVVRNMNYPRTRTGIAVSYDGMETWEYVTDLFEGSVYGYAKNTSDGIIKIIDDTIYWRTSNGSLNAKTNFGAVDMNKIKPLKRFPQLHERTLQGFEFSQHGAIDGCAIPKAEGTMWAYNGYYPVKVSEGRVDVASAERIFGVTATSSENSVTLSLGDAKIVLSEGSNSLTVNGETKSFDRAVLSGGYIDIRSLSDIFGKAFAETENVYTIMEHTYVDKYQVMLDDMAN